MTHTPQPGARYLVQGTLKHARGANEEPHPGESAGNFSHGDEFFSNDPELLTQLHDLGAIRLPSEVEDPEVVAARERGLRDENEALKAELAKLKDAAASASPKSGRSARARNEAQEAAEAGEESSSSEDSEGEE